MNLLPAAGQSANLATQLWIEARFMQALILLLAVSLLNKKFSDKLLLTVLGIVFAIVTFYVFSGYAPSAYIDAYGLTTFKVVMEYLIIMILCFALYRFYINRQVIGGKNSSSSWYFDSINNPFRTVIYILYQCIWFLKFNWAYI